MISDKQKTYGAYGAGGIIAALITAGTTFAVDMHASVADVSQRHDVDVKYIQKTISDNNKALTKMITDNKTASHKDYVIILEKIHKKYNLTMEKLNSIEKKI